MNTWAMAGFFALIIIVFGMLDRTLNQIINLLEEIRDRLPPE